jgi:hypothetical protein
MTMNNERIRKPDRYYPIFFSLFRTVTIRSKSLEDLDDRNRRKEGKTKKKKETNVLFAI